MCVGGGGGREWGGGGEAGATLTSPKFDIFLYSPDINTQCHENPWLNQSGPQKDIMT